MKYRPVQVPTYDKSWALNQIVMPRPYRSIAIYNFGSEVMNNLAIKQYLTIGITITGWIRDSTKVSIQCYINIVRRGTKIGMKLPSGKISKSLAYTPFGMSLGALSRL